MSTPQRLEDGPTRRLVPPSPHLSHNQPTRHYVPRHAAHEPDPENTVTPQPVHTPVGDTTTRMPAVQTQRQVAVPQPPRSQHAVPVGRDTAQALTGPRAALGGALRALRKWGPR